MQSNWLDDIVDAGAEATARRLSRRGMLRQAFDLAFKGAMIGVLGLSSGRKAWADACGCSPAGGRWCNNCPSSGCPSGQVACLKVNGVPQAQGCVWEGGSWNEDCLDGTCRTCIDCWPSGGGGYESSCTCRSSPYSCGGGGGGECDGWEICGKCKCI